MANYRNQNQKQFSKEKKTKIDSPCNLPEDIIKHIFTFLPIKDAIVIASTVSPMYKSSLRHNRQFLFGKDFHFRYTQRYQAATIDRLFNSHEGEKIKSFMLHIDPVGIEALIRKWLQICTQKDLEDLELHFYQPGFTVDFNVLNALPKLKTLKLVKCVIQCPNVPNGLRFLQTLSLCNLHMTKDMFDVLIKHCKMLKSIDLINCSTIKKLNLIARENKYFKKLKIVDCRDLKEIEIDSPTLHSIFYHGKFSIVRIIQGMQLYEAFFYFIPSQNYIKFDHLEALVKDLSHVSVLTTTPLLIESVAARIRNGIYQEAQYWFENLIELQLFMKGGMSCNPYDITMFAKNCPSLEKLFIDLNDYQFDLAIYWQLYHKHHIDNCNYRFTKLKVVVIRNFEYMSAELQLVKQVLQRATILERLILIPPKIINGRLKFKIEDAPKYDKLFCSWRASTRVIVKLHENYVEKTLFNPIHSKFWL